MGDALSSDRAFRTLNILDDFDREALAIDVDTSGGRVFDRLKEWLLFRGTCARRTARSFSLTRWCLGERERRRVHFIEPGKPPYSERFNRSYRCQVLDVYIFPALEDIRYLTDEWRRAYDTARPHEALNNMTPAEYVHAYHASQNTTYRWFGKAGVDSSA